MRRLNWAIMLAGFVLAMPPAALADDQEIANQIAHSFKASGRMKDYKVGVKVQDGTAWLKGTVANEEQMTMALMIAEDTYGIDRVVNNLAIAQSKTIQRDRSRNYPQPGLRQPESVTSSHNGMNFAANGPGLQGVVRASMELPEHAQQELAVGGPMQPMGDDVPMAAQSGNPMPMQPMPMSGEPQAYPMGARAAQPMPQAGNRRPMPLPIGARGPYQQVSQQAPGGEMIGAPQPMPMQGGPIGAAAPAPMHYDSPSMPGYAWPSYAAYPNYGALTYPKQYSPTAWPYIGPFYPYPQVPLGWRKVTLEWDDGWWFLDFKDSH